MSNRNYPTSDAWAKRLTVFSLTAAYFAMGTGLMAVIGLLEPMALQWQVDQSDIALLLTVFSLTFALAAPTVQVVFSRFAQRSLLLSGLFLLAVGSLGVALAPNYATGLSMRVVMALGAAAIGPVATAIATTVVEPREQMRTLAILFSGMTLASVVGVPIATWIGQKSAWQHVFVLIAVLSFGCAVLLARTVKLRQVGLDLSFRDFVAVFVSPATRWAVLTTWLHMSGQFVCYALIALLFVQTYGLDPTWLSPALFAMGLGHLTGNIIIGIYGDRFETDWVIGFSLLGMATIFALLWIGSWPPLVIAGLFFAWSVVGSLFQPPQQKRLIGLNPRIRALLLAMNASALYLGIAGGSALAAMIDRTFSLESLPLAAAVVTLLGAVTLFLSRRAYSEVRLHQGENS